MNRKFIVTDLTRFQKGGQICMAGIDTETGACIRPMPYYSFDTYKKHEVLPGRVLEGTLVPEPNPDPPHTEDHQREGALKLRNAVSSKEFLDVLEASSFDSVAEGFGYSFPGGERCLPLEESKKATCSIITVALGAGQIEIFEDTFKPGRIKAHFQDSRTRFSFAPITDLGFYDYAMKHQSDGTLDEVSEFVRTQERVFLRVGLSRPWANPSDGRNGCWLQINGIYTFPDYLHEIRSYSD